MAEITLSPLVVGIGGTIITFLLGVNGWFIRRLVQQIDQSTKDTRDQIRAYELEIAGLKGQLQVIALQLESFKAMVSLVPDLKTRIAVMEAKNSK